MLNIVFIVVLAIFGAGLAYFIFIGVRALHREAKRLAMIAGHSPRAAAWRALTRMAVWAAFFAALYFFLFFLGRRIGWWSVLPGLGGLAATIGALILADRLLIGAGHGRGQQAVMGGAIILVLVVFGSVAWLVA